MTGNPNDPPHDDVTVTKGSLEDEEHAEIDPQTPGGAIRKLREETGEGEGPVDKAKRALEEVDRQVSGEYERRDEQPGGG